MSDAEAKPFETDSPRDESGDRILAIVNYVLCFLAFSNGITLLIAAILAYVRRDQAQPWLKSHFDYQIRTFWYGLVIFVVGFFDDLDFRARGAGLAPGRHLAGDPRRRRPDPGRRRTSADRSERVLALGPKHFPALLRRAQTACLRRS